MSSLVALLYYGGFTVLFFFWIYGIVSFALDLKNKILPGLLAYRRNRTLAAEGETDRSDVPGTDRSDDTDGLY